MAAAIVPAVSWASSGDTSSDTQPSTPLVLVVNRPEQVGGAGEIVERQLEEQSSRRSSLLRAFWRIAASYAVLFLIAWSKIVGFEVSPVTDSSLDVALERAAGQQVARDVVEPEALAQAMELAGRFGRGAPRGRGARQDELLHSVGEALVGERGRDTHRLALHFLTGVAHGDAETAAFEHQHVIQLVTHGGDLLQRDLQVPRQPFDHGPLMGGWVSHIEVVRLRSRRADLGSELFLKRRLAPRDASVVVADADHFHDSAEHLVEGRDNRGLTLNRRCLTVHTRRLTRANVPIGGTMSQTSRPCD